MMTKYSVSCLLVAALFAACDDDHEAPVNPDLAYPAVITAQGYTYDNPEQGTTWVGADHAIGVSMMKQGTDEIITPYSNLQYFANGIADQDYFVPANNETIPYFPATGEKRDIAAYYPYSAEVVDNGWVINLKENKKEAEKLLFARVNQLDKDHRKMMLKMRPVLSRIIFNLGEVEESIQNSLTVTLKKCYLTGMFHTTNGTVSYRATDETGPIKLVAPKEEKAQQADFILQGLALPVSSTAHYEVEVKWTEEGKPNAQKKFSKLLTAENINELKSGYTYTFKPTFTEEGMMLNCTSAPIQNWQPGGDSIEGDGEEIQ